MVLVLVLLLPLETLNFQIVLLLCILGLRHFLCLKLKGFADLLQFEYLTCVLLVDESEMVDGLLILVGGFDEARIDNFKVQFLLL